MRGSLQGTKRILEKAQAGDAEAQYLTGLYYEDKGNADEAFLWYDRSATQGFVYGINAVAIYYLKGMAVKHDTGKAIALLESIAAKFNRRTKSRVCGLLIRCSRPDNCTYDFFFSPNTYL